MDWSKYILPRSFYNRSPSEVAQELLGKYLVRKIENEDLLVGRIVETEAYLPFNDSAAHNFKGETSRNKSLWKDAGYAYVHSMRQYCLLDVTTEGIGMPGSVLIRATEPIGGMEIKENITNGPGKMCRAFQIAKEFDGLDMTISENNLFISKKEENLSSDQIGRSSRIGISTAKEAPLRFWIQGNPHVSKGP